MTYEEKKRFLRQYLDCERRIKALLEEREKWEAIGTKITQNLSPAPSGGGTSNKVERAGCELTQIDTEIGYEIKTACELRNMVKKAIEGVKSEQRRIILQMRYMSGMSFAEIAKTLKKSEKNIYSMHRKSVESIRTQKTPG